MALTDIERTRTYQPVAGGEVYSETRNFGRSARPFAAPRIRVTGMVEESGGDVVVVPGVEIYYIEYLIYEPGDNVCDAAWYDDGQKQWVPDQGAVYTLRLRLTARDSLGFDFENGSGRQAEDDYGFSESGLEMMAPEQYVGGRCADGVCATAIETPGHRPCDPNADDPDPPRVLSLPLSWTELDGFSPFEVVQ